MGRMIQIRYGILICCFLVVLCYLKHIFHSYSISYGGIQYLSEKTQKSTDKMHSIRKGCHRHKRREIEVLENGFGDPENPDLLELIRCNWIKQGSNGPLALDDPSKIHYSQYGQSEMLDGFMERRTSKYYMCVFVHTFRKLLIVTLLKKSNFYGQIPAVL